MTHDPSSAPKFWWPDTGTSNFSRLPCILVPDFSGASNWGPVEYVLLFTRNLGSRDSDAVLPLAAEMCLHHYAVHRLQIK